MCEIAIFRSSNPSVAAETEYAPLRQTGGFRCGTSSPTFLQNFGVIFIGAVLEMPGFLNCLLKYLTGFLQDDPVSPG